jgi:HEPN domain-containing protein
MSNPTPDPAIVQLWIESARSDLAYAEMAPPPDAGYEQGCFHAQQAVEKGLKALLLRHGQEPPYVHNIQVLLDRVAQYESDVAEIKEGATLTSYAVGTRYPSHHDPVTQEEWRIAAALAHRILEWITQRL